jgi:hypothetical protein
MAEETEQKNIIVHTNTFLGSQYAQIAGISVTENDITLEFAYKHPRNEIKEAQVVARVTMPKDAALGLAELIFKVKQSHEERKRSKNG